MRALTGVDTDRLKEEKARGISIELGYAYLPLDDGDVLGFVDVPGHEKLVHTMVAGASGIDFALLVVAADDGVMPQTREHLAILDLLGVARGAVALTQDRSRRRAAHACGAATRSPRYCRDACCVGAGLSAACDARGRPGVAALRAHLRERRRACRARATTGCSASPSIASSRCRGTARSSTGTFAGASRVGDTVLLMPTGSPVRVRGIHAQNRPAEVGAPASAARSIWPASRRARSSAATGSPIRDCRASERIDVLLTLLADAPHALAQWAPLHVHLGTQHRVAHVVLLEGDALAPGQHARVQLVFERPVCALPGDRFIVRNAQASRTVGGGARARSVRAGAQAALAGAARLARRDADDARHRRARRAALAVRRMVCRARCWSA